MKIKLKRDTLINEWVGSVGGIGKYKKGEMFEVDPNNIVEKCYVVEKYSGGPHIYIPLSDCEKVK